MCGKVSPARDIATLDKEWFQGKFKSSPIEPKFLAVVNNNYGTVMSLIWCRNIHWCVSYSAKRDYNSACSGIA